MRRAATPSPRRIDLLPFVGAITIATVAAACAKPGATPVDPRDASPAQRAMVDSIAAALAGPMQALPPEEALLVELDALYAPLDEAQRGFMEAVRRLPGADPTRAPARDVDWVRIEGQRVRSDDGERTMSLQLLPPEVWHAYHAMNEAMRAALGSGLVVGSGYRTPANQLFVFVTYMPYYDYSWEQTRPHVSLPGASDHNRPERQGIDFVSEQGVDLRYGDPAAFAALPEYRWLREHAARFGFVGGEPGGPSPWHWRYQGPDEGSAPGAEVGRDATRDGRVAAGGR